MPTITSPSPAPPPQDPVSSASIAEMSSGNSLPQGIAVDLLFAARPFTGLEHHALHILRGLHSVGASVDALLADDVISEVGDAAAGHRLVPFPGVPRGLRLGREQWSLPWRFRAYARR